MTKRLLLCLAISLSIHALVILQPWTLMAISRSQAQPPDKIPVKLLDQADLPQELFSQENEDKKDKEEGISFEAEGYVSAGYLDLLKARIFTAWEYPPDAIQMGQEGVVRIRFVLDAQGGVIEATVIRSAGSRSLDNAALNAVRKAGPFGPFNDIQTTGTMGITGNFCYVLD
jgi:periplasmic protein TonB